MQLLIAHTYIHTDARVRAPALNIKNIKDDVKLQAEHAYAIYGVNRCLVSSMTGSSRCPTGTLEVPVAPTGSWLVVKNRTSLNRWEDISDMLKFVHENDADAIASKWPYLGHVWSSMTLFETKLNTLAQTRACVMFCFHPDSLCFDRVVVSVPHAGCSRFALIISVRAQLPFIPLVVP